MAATMRAWTHSRAGAPSAVLSLSSNVKTPVLVNPTDVLVRITHASLSSGGSIMVHMAPFLIRAAPAIPELDFSGTLLAVGSGVPSSRNLSPGDAVFGSITVGPHIKKGVGTLAEYVVADAGSVVRMPKGFSEGDAAGLGVSGSTALVLVRAAGIKEGDKVMVNGASGGVGSFVVQMAKNLVGEGGRVVGICSGGNAEAVKSLGADEIIDYTAHNPLHAYLTTHHSSAPFAVIIDAHGISDLYLHCAPYLSPGKPYVTVGVAYGAYTVPSMLYAVFSMVKNAWLPRVLGGGERDYLCVNATADLEKLEKLAEMAGEGNLRVFVDSRWGFTEVLKAYERVLSRHAKGKIIVQIRDP
ncbi:MAG: zinc ion binding [Trichoglossum hirsutum]|nr:MAG: zinc ion binding [Trichoglossum hirsutum]